MTKFNYILVMILLIVYSDIGFSQNTNVNTKDSVVWQYFNAKQYEGNKRKYTEDDLYPPYVLKGQANDSVVAQYLRLLRNEIYARHGKVFIDKSLNIYFSSMAWYKSNINDPIILNIEKQNIDIIKQKENRIASSCILGFTKGPKQIIVNGKWGNRICEFGLIDEAGGIGPNGFTIDKNNNIIVLDQVNYRIQIFNEKGIFIDTISLYSTVSGGSDITVDDKGFIYLYSGEDYLIIKIDQTGKVLSKYVLPEVLDYTSIRFANQQESVVKIEARFIQDVLKKQYKLYSFTISLDPKTYSKNQILESLTQITLPTGFEYLDSNGNKYKRIFNEALGETILQKYNAEGKLEFHLQVQHEGILKKVSVAV